MLSIAAKRLLEFRLLLVSTFIYLLLIWLAYEGQTKHFSEIKDHLQTENRENEGVKDAIETRLINLNTLKLEEDLQPYLMGLADAKDRAIVAKKMIDRTREGDLDEIKDLLSIQFSEAELRKQNLERTSYLGKKLLIQDSTLYIPKDSLSFIPLSQIKRKQEVFPPTNAGTSSIAGTVFEALGDSDEKKGFAGILVILYGSKQDSTVTDAQGRYQFNNLSHDGIYIVAPSLYAPCPIRGQLRSCTYELKGRPERYAKVVRPQSAIQVDFVGSRLAGLDRYKLSQLTSNFLVRSPAEYQNAILTYAIFLYLFLIYLVHFLWRMGIHFMPKAPFFKKGTMPHAADPFILPLFHILSGIGISLMMSLRAPLRQELLFVSFAVGAMIGTLLIWITSQISFQKYFAPQSNKVWASNFKQVFRLWLPAFVAFVLFILLGVAGNGPGGTKVNLWGFQPSEFIKIGMVFFMASYFTIRWEQLRMQQEIGQWLPSSMRNQAWLRKLLWMFPSLTHILPILGVMLGAVLMFFVMKDMGPAMIIMFTFLVLYALARKTYLALLMGLALYVLGLYLISLFPNSFGTFYTRIAMMLSPWDNFELGGEHLAQGFWALSAGGWFGMGMGLGAPEVIPAAHTDMVLAALGEELGFIGLCAIITLLFLLPIRGFLIAQRGLRQGTYTYFLALGLTLLLGIEILIILGGILGLMPLTGVVTPFISSGKTSMLANAFILGILASLSNETTKTQLTIPEALTFAKPLLNQFQQGQKYLKWVWAGMGCIMLLNLFWLQGWKGDENLVKAALVRLEDKDRKYKQNPRIGILLSKFQRGVIRDRNGVPLAASDCKTFRDFAAQDSTLLTSAYDVDLDRDCINPKKRIYPFRAHTFFLLGDYNSRIRAGYPAAQYLEYDLETSANLSGLSFDKGFLTQKEVLLYKNDRTTVSRDLYNYSQLVPLLRAQDRYPFFGKAGALATRQRDLRLTTDIRLQVEAARILQGGTPPGKRSAVVVIDVATGGVLANVSYPLPTDVFERPHQADSTAQMDFSTHGQYPPGSTFKMVTAIAAYRKENNESQVNKQRFICKPLADGRVGNFIQGYNRPIRDASKDHAHGTVDIKKGMVVSCNAYFAQLGTFYVKENTLLSTMDHFTGIQICDPTGQTSCKKLGIEERRRILKSSMPQVAYGQGSLIASPLGIAQVAATIANNGRTSTPFWIESEGKTPRFVQVLPANYSNRIADYMHEVVKDSEGTARGAFSGFNIEVAGKTGTAEHKKGETEHAWFAGFAPYGGKKKIAFAIIVEKSGYGGTVAAPIARALVQKAKELKIIE